MTPKRKDAAREARPTLPQLCSEAADHVARARIALDHGSYDADQAMLHLDDAIACLKRLLAYGRSANGGNPHASLRSA